MAGAFSVIFETTTPHGSVATAISGVSISQRVFTSDRSHNAVLFSPLSELLAVHQLTDLEIVLVGSGPGSYSGTRVGIAAAQGVAMAAGCPAVAIPSILAVPSAQDGSPCLAIGDARRGSYWAVKMENFALVNEPELMNFSDFEICITKTIAAGMPIISFEMPERFPLPASLLSQIRQEFPNAERLLKVWNSTQQKSRDLWAAQVPQPIYLKPPHITPSKRSWLQPQS